jgi:uncharacterized protein YbjT (DUF2867 family)
MERLPSTLSAGDMTSHAQTQQDNTLTLVLGATGKTGRRVADRLAARGVDTRLASRTGSPPFDWNDVSSWPKVLDRVGAAYLCYHPDLAVPGAADTVGAFAEAAVGAGVRRLVLLSGRGEREAQRAEALVGRAATGSAATVTVVRASWFAQNFSESFLLDGVLDGRLALPVGDVPEPFIDVDDIADVVTAALTEDRHAGALYEVTGPRALTFAEAALEIARATGRPVQLAQIGSAEFAAEMAAQGVPGEVTALMLYLFTEVLDGRNAGVTDGVREALGRPPRDFSQYARRAAAAGMWTLAADASAR